MASLSKTSIDRLGDRLRHGSVSDADLRILDEYRRSFGDAYEEVVRTIREQLDLEPTGRPAESTPSIIEKLKRESIRLVQIQDIAGCRVVVRDVAGQERTTAALRAKFPGAVMIDRRAKPSFGYRAVHVVVNLSGKSVEVQIRTALQHLWAELSEKLSDVLDPSIKYGGGPTKQKRMLQALSEMVAAVEENEIELAKSGPAPVHLARDRQPSDARLVELKAHIAYARGLVSDMLTAWIKDPSQMGERA